MKRRFLQVLCAALCLVFTATCCLGCTLTDRDLSLPVSASPEKTPLDSYITTCLLNEAETIDLSSYCVTEEEVHRTYSNLYATDARLFFVSAEYSISASSEDRVSYLRPAYRFTGEERRRAEGKFEQLTSRIVAPVLDLTPLEQVAYLHDYMILHFTYDSDHATYDAYSLLISGRGVCQAYALLFSALCETLGISCVCVPCFDRAHEWNAVQLNGEWYHIDTVWDDTDRMGEVSHTYFLIGDEEMRTLRAAYDAAWNGSYTWNAPTPCTDRLLGAPWRNLTSPFTFPRDGRVIFRIKNLSYSLFSDLTYKEAP